jgi:hypothetical protein
MAFSVAFAMGFCHATLADEVPSPLTITDVDEPVVELKQTDEVGDEVQLWSIFGNEDGFGIEDTSSGFKIPLFLQAQAPTNSLVVAADGSIGMGTNLPQKIGNATTTGRFVNIRTDAAGGVARFVAQGNGGAQFHLVHTAAAVNQKVFRMQAANGLVSFNVVNDNLLANAVTGALIIKMQNGNIGLKTSNPLHPLHLASGAHCTSGGVWTNASSRELKQDIQPITSEQAQQAVRALQPVGYRYKNELDENYVGFIAEDVPEIVATKDRKSLSSMDVVAVLTKVVQDQQSTIANQDTLLQRQQKLLEEQRALLTSLTQRLDNVERDMSGSKTP